MQHSYTSELDTEGHYVLWRALKYPLLAVIVLLAAVELSTGMLIFFCITVALVFALAERVQKINARPHDLLATSRLMGDGGSFPNDEPEMEQVTSGSVRVMDGGSLERHRI